MNIYSGLESCSGLGAEAARASLGDRRLLASFQASTLPQRPTSAVHVNVATNILVD
jgi:hypothetical protein